MAKELYTRIIGTGSYLPTKIIKNSYFSDYEFYDPATGKLFEKSNEEIIQKFRDITNIDERRYVENEQVTSDLAVLAIQDACQSSGISVESLDFIVVAQLKHLMVFKCVLEKRCLITAFLNQ